MYEYLEAVGRAHDLSVLVTMLCVLAACPLPCGIPLNLLLEIMCYVHEHPASPAALSSAHHLHSDGPSVGVSTVSSSATSPHAEAVSSPPLIKRSAGSPFNRHFSVLPPASPPDVSRSLNFEAEDTNFSSPQVIARPPSTLQFLVIAACIKPVLVTTYVAAMPSLSLALTNVRFTVKTRFDA
jgi:hypothetical protein